MREMICAFAMLVAFTLGIISGGTLACLLHDREHAALRARCEQSHAELGEKIEAARCKCRRPGPCPGPGSGSPSGQPYDPNQSK